MNPFKDDVLTQKFSSCLTENTFHVHHKTKHLEVHKETTLTVSYKPPKYVRRAVKTDPALAQLVEALH